VYGGSNVGLMAALADAMLDELRRDHRGDPRMLVEREVANTALTIYASWTQCIRERR